MVQPQPEEEKLPFHYTRNSEMAKALLEQPLLEDDQVVPHVCRGMLFAKDKKGRCRLEHSVEGTSLYEYLASFADLPLTVLKRSPTTLSCEHRAKRQRHTAVPFNRSTKELQRSIAKAFLKQKMGPIVSSGRLGTRDLHAMFLPNDLKYVIMTYLSRADIMTI